MEGGDDAGPWRELIALREPLVRAARQDVPAGWAGWCDAEARRTRAGQTSSSSSRAGSDADPVEAWELEVQQHSELIVAGAEASSTDNEQQTISTTLDRSRSFWSSTGHVDPQPACEALLYLLEGAACRVAAVQLAVYRALYQRGYPVYPPRRMQVWTGASRCSLQPASPWYDVQPTDALQTFALWPHAPIGSFLQLRFWGKQQQQQEDLQYYLAVRYVNASGTALPPHELATLPQLLRGQAVQLAPAAAGVPGSVCDAVQAAARWGIGPEAALDAVALLSVAPDLSAPQWGAFKAFPHLMSAAGDQAAAAAAGSSSLAPAAAAADEAGAAQPGDDDVLVQQGQRFFDNILQAMAPWQAEQVVAGLLEDQPLQEPLVPALQRHHQQQQAARARELAGRASSSISSRTRPGPPPAVDLDDGDDWPPGVSLTRAIAGSAWLPNGAEAHIDLEQSCVPCCLPPPAAADGGDGASLQVVNGSWLFYILCESRGGWFQPPGSCCFPEGSEADAMVVCA